MRVVKLAASISVRSGFSSEVYVALRAVVVAFRSRQTKCAVFPEENKNKLRHEKQTTVQYPQQIGRTNMSEERLEQG